MPLTSAPAPLEAGFWDAQAEYDLGVLMQRYLAEHPPPDGSLFARDLGKWADRLVAHGRRNLDDLGAHPLQAVSEEA